MKKLLRVAMVLTELFALGNAMLMAFLMCAWMESDAFAHWANEADWWIEGGKRFVLTVAMSFAVSAIVFALNKQIFRWVGFGDVRLARITAGITFGSLVFSGAVGAVSFAVTKPYM